MPFYSNIDGEKVKIARLPDVASGITRPFTFHGLTELPEDYIEWFVLDFTLHDMSFSACVPSKHPRDLHPYIKSISLSTGFEWDGYVYTAGDHNDRVMLASIKAVAYFDGQVG